MVPVRPLAALATRVLSRWRPAVSRPARRSATRLGVEVLEDRLALSLITVTNLDDSGDGSLRWAIEEANQRTGPDTIVFDPGVFVPGMSVQLTSGQLSLTDTTGMTTIDGRGSSVTVAGTSHSRVFSVGVGVSAEMYALTITGGHAVFNYSDYMTGNGGGICNLGDLTVSGCILTYNFGSNEGGGIYSAADARMTVIGSTLSRNSADFGGGIGSRGELTVSGSNVSYNSAASDGGAIGNAAGVLTVSASTLSHNTAGNLGGGIYNTNVMAISASTLSYNSAVSNGGGIFTVYGNVTISESTFSGNSSGAVGGGICIGAGVLTVSESTIVYNSATTGGGIASYSPPYITTILHNVLVAQNFLRNSNPPSPLDLFGTFDASSSFNLIGDGSGGLVAAQGNLLGTSSSPLDPMLGPLQNNGGSTWTHALLAGSPAINAGDPTVLADPQRYDQRGLGFPRVVGGTIDIGAFEVQVLTSHHLAVVGHVVQSLVSKDSLPPGFAKSLHAKVDVARAQLDRGNTIPVVKTLDAVIKQVVAMRTAGKLTYAEAQWLIEAVQLAIDSITGD